MDSERARSQISLVSTPRPRAATGSKLVHRLAGGALLLALTALAAPAGAQASGPSAADRETARSLMDQGDERSEAKDYPGALKAYSAADALMHLPQTGIAVARAQLAAGLLIEARDTAIQVTHLPAKPGEPPSAARARKEAEALADQVGPLIPAIQVTLEGAPADVVVSVDAAPIPAAAASAPRKVNPGAHVVTATAGGYAVARAEVTVAASALAQVKLKLVPLPPQSLAPVPVSPVVTPVILPPVEPKGRHVSVLVPVGFSIGGAGLIAGAVTGAMTLSLASTLKGQCDSSGSCPHSSHDDLQKAHTLADVADVALAVGAVGVVLGVIGAVRSKGRPSPESQAHVEPLLGPGSLGLRGAF